MEKCRYAKLYRIGSIDSMLGLTVAVCDVNVIYAYDIRCFAVSDNTSNANSESEQDDKNTRTENY